MCIFILLSEKVGCNQSVLDSFVKDMIICFFQEKVTALLLHLGATEEPFTCFIILLNVPLITNKLLEQRLLR